MASTTGIEDNSSPKYLISVFPNPTTDVLHITSTQMFEEGFIYSIDGKLVKHISEQELLSKVIAVADFDSGLYYLQMVANNKSTVTRFTKN